MNRYGGITAMYSRLSVGDEDRDGGESNSIQNQKTFLESYAKQQQLTNIKHYIDDDESGRFFDRSAYVQMMEDVENGKVSIVIMKDMTRWGRDYLQVGNAMEIFRRNDVRFIAINNGIDSAEPNTLEFAPFINIMSEWYAKDISKKVKTGIKTKGMSGKPIVTEAPYGYKKDPSTKDFWLIDEAAAAVVRFIFALFMDGKNRNQIAVYLKNEQILTPTFYLKQQDRGTAKSRTLNEDNRFNWSKATLTRILKRQEYCGDVVNFKTTKHYRDKRNHYVDKSEWHITENVHEPIIDRTTFENVQRILENAPVKRPNGDGYTRAEYSKVPVGVRCPTQHRIKADAVLTLIADMLKAIAEYSKNDRIEFIKAVQDAQTTQQTADINKRKKRLVIAQKRASELEKLICKIYEDNALGKLPDNRYAALDAQYAKEQDELNTEIADIETAITGFEESKKSAEKFIALIDKYENFDTLTNTTLNELVEKILVHERDRKGSQDTTQEVEIYFTFVGRYMPPHFGEVSLTAEEQEELRKKEERKDRLHENYMRRKANGKYREYEERTKAAKKAEMDAKRAAIRAEDMARGVYIPVGNLPLLEPQIAANSPRTATL